MTYCACTGSVANFAKMEPVKSVNLQFHIILPLSEDDIQNDHFNILAMAVKLYCKTASIKFLPFLFFSTVFVNYRYVLSTLP